MARVARAMVTTKRVPGNREVEGGKGHGVGDEGGVQQRGQWRQQRGRWQRGWQASNVNKRAMAMAMVMAMVTVPTWAMVRTMRLVGNEKGNGKGGKFNGDGDEGGGQ
jgi:hypothetical protein